MCKHFVLYNETISLGLNFFILIGKEKKVFGVSHVQNGYLEQIKTDE